MFIFSEYQPTFNKAIDLCTNIIYCARKNNLAVKALHLDKIHYEWYISGVKTLLEKQKPEGWEEQIAEIKTSGVQFDGVNIERGSRLQTKPVIIEYYQPTAQA